MEKIRISEQPPYGVDSEKLIELLKLTEGMNILSVKDLFKAAMDEIETYSFIKFQRLK